MPELPESIKAILKAEGVSVGCWKRMRVAWDSLPVPPDTETCQRILDEAEKLLREFSNIQIIEIRTLPEKCATVADAEKAVILSAANRSQNWLEACRKAGIGKTTLYRKLAQYGVDRPRRPQMVFKVARRIAVLQAEIDQLKKLLPEEVTA